MLDTASRTALVQPIRYSHRYQGTMAHRHQRLYSISQSPVI